jgi:decaprenylphospho-beta-D-erythro-pentofuranosid-2-ulose 2-reductase
MINALWQPQSVLVLGGTSDIAGAIVRELPAGRLRRVVLAGRDQAGLALAAAQLGDDLKASGSPDAQVSAAHFDAADTESHPDVIAALFGADVDLVIMAFGVLGDQSVFESDTAAAVAAARVNYLGTVSAGLEVARHLRRQGHGRLVVITSVAGDRPRRSNFLYGSSKAGQDAFAQGLGDALHGSGAEVLVVRPGFVHTKMTAGLPAAPLSVDPARVARDTVRGLRRGAHTVYSPPALRAVMAGLKAVPRPLFRRLPL